jgi:hypothetical protein
MIAIAVFLTLIGIAAGFAVWNDWRSPWRDTAPNRLEPRFPLGSLQNRFRSTSQS